MGEERIPITHVRMNRTREIVELGLSDIFMDNLFDWTWVNADDEDLCQILNFDVGSSKFVGRLFKGKTVTLSDHEYDNDEEFSTPVKEPAPSTEDKSFYQQLTQTLTPPPPKKKPRKTKTITLAAAQAPPSKRTRSPDAPLAIENENHEPEAEPPKENVIEASNDDAALEDQALLDDAVTGREVPEEDLFGEDSAPSAKVFA